MNIVLVRRTHSVVTNIYGPFANCDEAWDYMDKVKAHIKGEGLGIDMFVLSQTEFYVSRLQK